MKNRILFTKFNKTFAFVKPLYKKAGFSHTVSLKTDTNLRRSKCKSISVNLNDIKSKSKKTILPGSCEAVVDRRSKETHYSIVIPDTTKDTKERQYFNENEQRRNHRIVKNNTHYSNIFENNDDCKTKKNDSWLIVLPAPKLAKENLYSIILRCFLCQLGLVTFLFVWTSLWVFVICRFEEPYEIETLMHFKSKETQLVIDLATELRQITPLSSKWLERIEERMKEQSQLTETHLGIHTHWDLYGTIFFVINLMVTLGTGCTIPSTFGGQCSAVCFAFFAVPVNIYLVINASSCIVVRLEKFSKNYKHYKQGHSGIEGKIIKPTTASTGSCENIEINRRGEHGCFQWKIIRCFCAALNCKGILITLVLYYISGAIAFGGLQQGNFLTVILFPLAFHANGNLDKVTGPMRILYGLYVEGAIFLLACTVASLRRRSKSAVWRFLQKYRLIIYE